MQSLVGSQITNFPNHAAKMFVTLVKANARDCIQNLLFSCIERHDEVVQDTIVSSFIKPSHIIESNSVMILQSLTFNTSAILLVLVNAGRILAKPI